ncbi:MAG: hypothetical protein M5U01_04480 [Ardenticatenaceae bacterium]|nr:hypothetical protein [Ardenticatenaceae bacterium]
MGRHTTFIAVLLVLLLLLAAMPRLLEPWPRHCRWGRAGWERILWQRPEPV